MHPASEFKKIPDEAAPFHGLKICEKWKILADVDERGVCSVCLKSRKYFCYNCYIPVPEVEELIPKVNLPLKIDIIKHAREIDGKSTAAHAAVLAPNDVRILTYPSIPNYNESENVVLIYPGKDAVTVSDIVNVFRERSLENSTSHIDPICRKHCNTVLESTDCTDGCRNTNKGTEGTKNNSLIKKAIFIDSTWNQSKGIYNDNRLKGLPRVILKSRISQFWRHQKGSPRWYLATIEALHQFLIELHEALSSFASPRSPVCELCMQSVTGSLPKVGLNRTAKSDSENDESTIDSNIDCELINYCVGQSSMCDRHYNGEYDNLLFFFRFMYNKIHTLYNHDSLLSYKRPLE